MQSGLEGFEWASKTTSVLSPAQHTNHRATVLAIVHLKSFMAHKSTGYRLVGTCDKGGRPFRQCPVPDILNSKISE